MIGLPYFQFYTSEWLVGDITMESYEIQGFFINVCAFYWEKECSIALVLLKKRFRNDSGLLDSLIECNILKVDKKLNVRINFLDQQYSELYEKREKRVIAGRKGGLAKPKQSLSNAKATLKHLDKIRKEEIREDKNRKDNTNTAKAEECFESFWKTTRFPKLRTDPKGDMKKKYLKLLKEKVTPDQILFACDIFAEQNKGNKFAIGMRKFLDSKENLEQMLEGDFAPRELTKQERFEEQMRRIETGEDNPHNETVTEIII